MIGKIDLFIVDDENLIRHGIVSLLKNSDINVVGAAENGEELIKFLKHKTPSVVLLDLEMPILNGSKTLNILAKKFPNVKTIIISRYHDQELIKDLFNRGARAFLSKSADVQVMFEAIRRVYRYGIFTDNISHLIQNPSLKDGHYYRLIFSKSEVNLLPFLLEANKSYDDIASQLFRSVKTVKNHANTIYKKVGVRTRIEFIEYGKKAGLDYVYGNLENADSLGLTV